MCTKIRVRLCGFCFWRIPCNSHLFESLIERCSATEAPPEIKRFHELVTAVVCVPVHVNPAQERGYCWLISSIRFFQCSHPQNPETETCDNFCGSPVVGMSRCAEDHRSTGVGVPGPGL